MTGYLAGLLAQERGHRVEPAVVPRLPSLYESWPAPPEPGPSLEPVDAPGLPEDPPFRLTADHGLTSLPFTEPTRPQRERFGLEPRPIDSGTAPQPEAAAANDRRESEALDAARIVVAHSGQPVADHPRTHRPGGIASPDRVPPPAPASASHRTSPPTSVFPAESATSVREQPGFLRNPRPMVSPIGAAFRSAPVVIPSNRPFRHAPGSGKEVSEPVVEVRIGRIEVRGGSPAPPPPIRPEEPVPTSAAMSLAEYLRRRSGWPS